MRSQVNTFFFTFLFLRCISFAQNESVSNILKFNDNDTLGVKLLLKGAEYNAEKNDLPYYSVTKNSAKARFYKAQLIDIKYKVVSESQNSFIQKHFGKFLTAEFELIDKSGIAKNNRINQYHIIPFRINKNNKVEELLNYSVSWAEIPQSAKNQKETTTSDFKSSSVLASGEWYKIGITQTGIHKITRELLVKMGVNTTNLNPNKIRVFGNGGKMLPELNSASRIDDLEENPVQVVAQQTSNFGNADYILFYATNTNEWIKTNSVTGLKYRVIKNLYCDTSFYFINISNSDSKKINSKNSLSQTPNVSTTSYDYYNYHEEDITNFGKSGRNFYGERFDIITNYNFTWNDGDFITEDSLIAETRIVATGKENSFFTISGNGLSSELKIDGYNTDQLHSDYALANQINSYALNNSSGLISVNVTKLSPKTVGNLDKLTVNARRALVLTNKQFTFRDSRISKAGNICRFNLNTGSNTGYSIWNVSEPLNPFIQLLNSGANSFVAEANFTNEYCIAPTNDYYTPTFVSKIANQNLHGITQADYLIITHPLFIREAQRLGAFHQQKDGLTYAVATTEQIYNEFSSGRPDICGIRDFIRMLYTKNIDLGKEVKYVLLMGDGSFRNKSKNLVNNSNLIPTYQSHESLSDTRSVALDDFYGLMDDNEGYLAEHVGRVDIGVGRFTCRTVTEVQSIINKIENYYKKDQSFEMTNSTKISYSESNSGVMGDWRNWLLFLADDEDGALHMTQSDGLTRVVANESAAYNFDKIFIDAYQRTSSPGGYRYLDASNDFVKRLKKGALIFNYTGHGGEVGLTSERMVDLDMINKLDNFSKLPLFITATCEFSRYDDPGRTSAGELCLINPNGGAIAMLTTCRIAYADKNENLNIILLRNLFKRDANGRPPRLGDVMQETKSQLAQSIYYANFHLLGDPALTLAYPEMNVVTNKINSKIVDTTRIDSLTALSKITISGFIADKNGNKLTSFNGLVYPTVFDKEQNIICLANSDDSRVNIGTNEDPIYVPFDFNLQKNILYRGKVQVINGDFSFTFVVPKDISFSPGPGKITYYATNGQTDASGIHSRLMVGGASQNSIVDNDGPEIGLFMNDKSFANGGFTNENPIFYADLVDSTGINTVGTGLGHDLTVILDEKSSKPIVLNDYYEANLNSYQSGRIRYPFEKLEEGPHQLSFKAWDIQNNSSSAVLDFVVAPSAELALEHVLNYPNPFTTYTKFMFQHNQGCAPLKVVVQVYTVTGKVVKTIQKTVECEGTIPGSIDWDGKDDYGSRLGRGVYIYKLAILNPDNKKAEKIEKLVILN